MLHWQRRSYWHGILVALCLISSYCVVTESHHTSSLAWGAALNGLTELMHQVYEGWPVCKNEYAGMYSINTSWIVLIVRHDCNIFSISKLVSISFYFTSACASFNCKRQPLKESMHAKADSLDIFPHDHLIKKSGAYTATFWTGKIQTKKL